MKYRDVLEKADAHFRRAMTAQPEHFECRKGCTLCCFGLFEVSKLDVSLLESGVGSLSESERRRVVAESETVLAAHPHPEDWSSVSDSERDRFFEETAAVKCPFLDRRGACSIYENRPLLCRTFGLPIKDGTKYIGDECELNFTAASRSEKEKAAWDLADENSVDGRDEITIPQAVVHLAKLRKRPGTRRAKRS